MAFIAGVMVRVTLPQTGSERRGTHKAPCMAVSNPCQGNARPAGTGLLWGECLTDAAIPGNTAGVQSWQRWPCPLGTAWGV